MTKRFALRILGAMKQHTHLPTPQIRREIAARALMPERTVLGVYRNPSSHKPSTVARVVRAAMEIGAPEPEQPSGALPSTDGPEAA